MNRYLFDTCFLIDLERELRRGAGKAFAFLEAHPMAISCVCLTVAGEFGEGFGDFYDPACAAMLARFEMLAADEATAHQYARTTRLLRARGQLIGSNDLWIASSALAHGVPLVTNNRVDFGRVPGLSVVNY